MRLVVWLALVAGLACTSPSTPVPKPDVEITAAGSPRDSGGVPSAAGTLTAPRAIAFPEDDGPHDVLTEWWYYNGHLQGDEGQRYGFELVVFKRAGRGGRAGYAAHVAVTDRQRHAFQFAEDLSLPESQPSEPGTFQLAVGGIGARGGGGRDTLHGATASYSLALELHESKPPVLHGEHGYVGVGPTEMSYYYSRTRLAASGSLVDHGVPIAVTGEAWMDHQWGDFTLQGGGGWDWYGLQLNDGTDVMVSIVRDGGGGVVLAYGTLVSPAGEQTHVPGDAFSIRSLDRWTSPVTGAVYPMGWHLKVPAKGLDLRLDPVIPDQEMVTTASVNRSYWEGEVVVSGVSREGPISGLGYVELTGYGP